MQYINDLISKLAEDFTPLLITLLSGALMTYLARNERDAVRRLVAGVVGPRIWATYTNAVDLDFEDRDQYEEYAGERERVLASERDLFVTETAGIRTKAICHVFRVAQEFIYGGLIPMMVGLIGLMAGVCALMRTMHVSASNAPVWLTALLYAGIFLLTALSAAIPVWRLRGSVIPIFTLLAIVFGSSMVQTILQHPVTAFENLLDVGILASMLVGSWIGVSMPRRRVRLTTTPRSSAARAKR